MKKEQKIMDTNNNEREFYTLTDDDGNEFEFELIGVAEYKGATYYAMIPAEDEENEEGFCEYTVLKLETEEDGSESLVTIDDEDEQEDVGAYFDNLFSEELDYDAE